MNDIRRRPVAIFAGVLLPAVLIVLGLIWAAGARVPGSNGELIYFRGINDRGSLLPIEDPWNSPVLA
ncbi:MAG: hypothetical protein E2O74_00670 [Chloroflexi bacterium]|nr:MAG: hypothetical protein E2O74_00670 [Chloroflexota bacterium]